MQELIIEQSITEDYLVQSLYETKKPKTGVVFKPYVEDYGKVCNSDLPRKNRSNFGWKLA